MRKEVTIKKEQELFVIPCGEGFSCLGFKVCERRTIGLENELSANTGNKYPDLPEVGTIEQYNRYMNAVVEAKEYHEATGYRFYCELHPLLVGKEGKRVVVVSKNGSTRRFIVGKSTGFIPCHLEIKSINSNGGEQVYNDFDTVQVIG